jgi:hypothetical protein
MCAAPVFQRPTMVSGPLAISLTSMLSGINAATAEAGVAILGAVIAALPLVVVGALWRKVVLSFRGSHAVGTVTRTGPAGPRMCRAYISFETADGKEVTVPLTASWRTRPGDQLGIRYDPAKPEFATNRLPAAVVTHLLLPAGTLAAVGLAGVAGTLYTSATGGFDAFLNGYAVVVFTVIALIAFVVSYIRYRERRDRVPEVPGQTAAVTHGSGAGAVLAPVLIGAVMLTFALLFALGG